MLQIHQQINSNQTPKTTHEKKRNFELFPLSRACFEVFFFVQNQRYTRFEAKERRRQKLRKMSVRCGDPSPVDPFRLYEHFGDKETAKN
jgi:hypothetical protein